jgi:Domain of unknown function (DUF6916)
MLFFMDVCSRRQFVADLSLVVAAAALAPAVPRCLPVRLAPLGRHELSRAAFAEHLHTRFQVRAPAGNLVAMELVEAQSLPWRAARGDLGAPAVEESFSLMFRLPVGQAFAQGTYDFAHEEMGRFAMFIVPVGRPNGDSQGYEAVFHRVCQDPTRQRAT